MRNIFKLFMTACLLTSVAITGVAQKDYSQSEGLLNLTATFHFFVVSKFYSLYNEEKNSL